MNPDLKLCSECYKVRFKIGVPVFADRPEGPRVCTKKCAAKSRKVYKQDAEDEAAEIERLMDAAEAGEELF